MKRIYVDIVGDLRPYSARMSKGTFAVLRCAIRGSGSSYVVHGDDVSDEVKRQHKIPYSLGIVKYVPYTPGISTTEIIERIKNGNY